MPGEKVLLPVLNMEIMRRWIADFSLMLNFTMKIMNVCARFKFFLGGSGVAGSEDFACRATLPTTPLDFQGKV